MIKAVVKNGVVVLRDPLPLDWAEGTEVQVEVMPSTNSGDTGNPPAEDWMNEIDAIAAQGDPNDDLLLEKAIQDVRRREKELARVRLGLGL